MATWKNLDTLDSFGKLKELKNHVDIAAALSGEEGGKRVADYSTPMAAGLSYNYAAKEVDETVLSALAKLADEAQLIDKFQELYNGAVINTGENRMVLHHLARKQLGNPVVVDGVDKREFYVAQQKKAADFANKVHAGEITNEAGEKFTTVVQIGIGGSDLGPRALYIALENWAKANNTFKMEAKFISNVDPDDAAAVLASVDLAHSLFIVVSKSGTTLETLTNEAFVKDALTKAGLNPSKHMLAVTSETSPLAKSEDYLTAIFMDDYIGGVYSSVPAARLPPPPQAEQSNLSPGFRHREKPTISLTIIPYIYLSLQKSTPPYPTSSQHIISSTLTNSYLQYPFTPTLLLPTTRFQPPQLPTQHPLSFIYPIKHNLITLNLYLTLLTYCTILLSHSPAPDSKPLLSFTIHRAT